jgi:O-antigen/teichoic acid export membrane protein
MQGATLGDMARGSAVMIAMRWCVRLIGLVSTMILARLLTPQDFGVVAMATVFVGFIELFSFMNFDLALIRIVDSDRSHYDTAWTLQAILGLSLSLFIASLAPVSAWYFEEPRLALVVRVLAANSFLQGLSNIGLADFRKNMEFHRDLQFNVYSRLITFIATMVAVALARNYWALVTGLLVGNVARMVLSYVMHPFRPRFDLSRRSDILSFSSWMLLFQIGTYLRNRIDTIVVGRITAAGVVGMYNVAYELSSMPTNELIIPTGRALFPAYAQLAGDRRALRTALQTSLGFFFTIVMPVCLGMTVVAPFLVRVVLGDQWASAAPLMSVLTFAGGFNGISHVIATFHAANGRERFTAALTWGNAILLLPALLIGSQLWGVPGIAGSRAVVSFLVLIVALASVVQTRILSGTDIVRSAWRPATSAAAMSAVLRMASPHFTSPLAELLVDAVVGGSTFFLVMAGLWYVSGRPEGVESMSFAFLGDLRRAVLARGRRYEAKAGGGSS